MKTGWLETAVGVFVLLGVAAIGYLALRLGTGDRPGAGSYLLEARFANAGGLHSGSNVTLAGVTVGRVENVRVDISDFSAIVTLRLRSGVNLPEDTMASIKTSGLIGDKFVALSAGAEEVSLEPGARITLTESAVDIEGLLGKMAFGSTEDPDDTPEEMDAAAAPANP
jgi:phospholipid/cholesterol/gamma-HCH transport system substrate-binding protein